MRMTDFGTVVLLALAAAGCSTMDTYATVQPDPVQENKVIVTDVDGAAMYSDRTIIHNIANSPNHATLMKWIEAAGLTDTLSSEGPFTLFAPTDKAFAAVPKDVTGYLTKKRNRATLIRLLNYHIVPGRISFDDLKARIEAGDGRATLTTLAGEKLAFTLVNTSIKIDGMSGSTGYIEKPDIAQSNGLVHVVNGVLVPTW